jgi:hypothetical protein
LALACAAKAGLGGKRRFSCERFSIESPTFSELITQQITRDYQQGEGFLSVIAKIRGMMPAVATQTRD